MNSIVHKELPSPPLRLHIVPVTFREACEFVEMWHRHLGPSRGHKFSIGVADDDCVLHGVAMVGRPVSFTYDDGLTLEVNRTATDGTPNANSCLYGAAWRVAKGLGYRRLITYTQQDESGASLRAAGFKVVADRPPRSGWNSRSRPREPKPGDHVPRRLWEAS